MTGDNRGVAVGVLTERDVAMLGEGFNRHYPLTGAGDFAPLLAAIDAADCAYGSINWLGGRNDTSS